MPSARWRTPPILPCSERRSPTSNSSPALAPCGPASARINYRRLRRLKTFAPRDSWAPKASCCFPTTISMRRYVDERGRTGIRPVTDFSRAADIVERGVVEKGLPRGSCRGRQRRRRAVARAFGRLDYRSRIGRTQLDTIFDLASLTKVIATTSLVDAAAGSGQVIADDKVGDRIASMARPRSRKRDAAARCFHIAPDLTAWLPFYRDHTGRQEFEHAICSLPSRVSCRIPSRFTAISGSSSLDLSSRISADDRLQPQAEALLRSITKAPLLFNPPFELRPSIAPTEADPWRGRKLVGEVA